MESPVVINNPRISISPSILEDLESQVHEAGQVVVHCIQVSDFPSYIRIWPTTYLYDQFSSHRSELVHAENISYFPTWKPVAAGENHFTLIFSGLPKSCMAFDLLEQCDNQAGAFRATNVPRNDSDVYYLQV